MLGFGPALEISVIRTFVALNLSLFYPVKLHRFVFVYIYICTSQRAATLSVDPERVSRSADAQRVGGFRVGGFNFSALSECDKALFILTSRGPRHDPSD